MRDFLLAVQMAEEPVMRAWLLLAGLKPALRRAAGRAAVVRRRVDRNPHVRVIGKGNHERVIPLHPEVVAALAAVPDGRPVGGRRGLKLAAVSTWINRHLPHERHIQHRPPAAAPGGHPGLQQRPRPDRTCSGCSATPR